MQKLVQDNVFICGYWKNISNNSLFNGTRSFSQVCKRWKTLVKSPKSRGAVIAEHFHLDTDIINRLDVAWKNMKEVAKKK